MVDTPELWAGGEVGEERGPRWELVCASTRCVGAAEKLFLPHPRELTPNQKLERCQEIAWCKQGGDGLEQREQCARAYEMILSSQNHQAPPPEIRISLHARSQGTCADQLNICLLVELL